MALAFLILVGYAALCAYVMENLLRCCEDALDD